MLVLVYSDKMTMLKGIKLEGFLSRVVIKNYNVIISRKNFYDQPIDSDIKWYKEIKLTGQDVYYTTGHLLECHYIENNYILIVVVLIR